MIRHFILKTKDRGSILYCETPRRLETECEAIQYLKNRIENSGRNPEEFQWARCISWCEDSDGFGLDMMETVNDEPRFSSPIWHNI